MKNSYHIAIAFVFIKIILLSGYDAYNPTIEPPVSSRIISWCTISVEEQKKCEAFAKAVKLANRTPLAEELLCKPALDKEQCMIYIENGVADITTLDPGEVFVAGRYHSLVPIMEERYGPEKKSGYYSIAVVHARNEIRSLYDLKNKSACFPGVAQLAGWVVPLVTLMEQYVMNVTDCNNLVKSASNFFGNSCAPGCLIDKYNPSGDNPMKMCDLCKGGKGSRCSGGDPYAGFEGAFKCLVEGGGQVAFIKHDTVQEVMRQPWYRGPRIDTFSLLCPDGRQSTLDQYRTCNWGYVPSNVVIISSAVLPEKRKKLQIFLQNAAEEFYRKSNYSGNSSRYDWNNRDRSNYDWNTRQNGTISDRDRYDSRNNNNNRDRYDDYNRDRSSDYNRDRNSDYNRDRSSDYNRDRGYYSTTMAPLNRTTDRWGNYVYNQSSTPYNWDRSRSSTTQSPYDWDRSRSSTTESPYNWDRSRSSTTQSPYNWDRSRSSTTQSPYNWDRNANRSTPYSWDRTTTESPYNWNRRSRQADYGTFNETDDLVANFSLFSSYPYGMRIDLLFLDSTTALLPISDNRQTFKGYLGDYSNLIRRQRMCPNPPARLCVVSDKEYEKCLRMRIAFRAQMLKPDLSCIKVDSQISCMSLIRDNAADLAVMDAGDIYKAGQLYDLIPIIAEKYDLDEPSYYVVAVAKQPDKETDLLYLKGKKSCHTGIGTAAGWVIPMGFLLSSERMRSYGCNSVRAASEFFEKSCVPGVLSREYTYGEWGNDNLCDLCHGSSSYYCARDSHEPFYGDSGALQCIVEGGGDVAFVRHTTILENTAGKNSDWWSRPMMPDDFELLCRDGTRARYNEYESCNLGKVASNAIVTLRYKSKELIDSYITLFMYAQQFYGSKYSEDFTFKMFVSDDNYHDLIFQDATQMLKTVPEEKRDYRAYLGPSFVKSVRLVDCTAGADVKQISYISFMVIFLVYLAKFW